MPLSVKPVTIRAWIAAAVAVLAVTGTVVGVSAASASSTPHLAATTTTIDHQLCYTANAQGFKIPTGVQLLNQFSTAAFPVQIGPVALHCNPVEKILPTGKVFPINFPNDHLLCFQIAAPQVPTPSVVASNQFGTAQLFLGQPNLLCLPSWKSLTGPPVEKTAAPPGLGHFACYPVVNTSGVYNPPPLMLQDEFSPNGPVPAQIKQVPSTLCVPTEKILPSGKIFKIIKPKWNLLCYAVSQTPIITPVFDKNQFGSRPVNIQQTNMLCPPTTIKIEG